MAEDQDKSDKTEEPSEQKLRKARQKGDVPMSREAGTFMTVFALALAGAFVLPTLGPRLMAALLAPLSAAGQIDLGTEEQALRGLRVLVLDQVLAAGAILAPLFGLMILTSLLAVALQGDIVVSLERIRPKASKISLLGGIKRLFSLRNLVDFLRSSLKVLTVGWIGYIVCRDAILPQLGVAWIGSEILPALTLQGAGRMLLLTLIFLFFVAGFDILWQRAQWRKGQRMSHKDIRDEHKESEGDPYLKARRIQIQRERARARIATAVPLANVILTNPTHYAVALRYRPGEDLAPVCVAKGADLMAARIREIAQAHDIPIIENRALARALFAGVEIDQMVPPEHWKPVAEIIGYLLDFAEGRDRPMPEGFAFRSDER
jgi:flagellar biosynthesis protein FlhB